MMVGRCWKTTFIPFRMRQIFRGKLANGNFPGQICPVVCMDKGDAKLFFVWGDLETEAHGLVFTSFCCFFLKDFMLTVLGV